MTTEKEQATEIAKKATLLILTAIDSELDNAARTFSLLVNKLHGGDEAKLQPIRDGVNTFVDSIVDTMIINKANRMSIILACICTAKQMIQMVGEDIFGETKLITGVKQ